MAPKKAKETAWPPCQFEISDLFIELGRLLLRLVCNFYRLVVRYKADKQHAIRQVIISMILEAIKTLLVLIARVLSGIFLEAALIIRKILTVILHLLRLLVLKVGSFTSQLAQELVIRILPRVLSEICFGAGKILTFIFHLLLLLVLKVGSFINQIARGLVDLAGYGISSAVFITILVLIWWYVVPVLEEIMHARDRAIA